MNVIQAQIQPVVAEGYSCVIAAIIVVAVSLLLWRGAKIRWKRDGHWGRKGLGADVFAVAMIAMAALILGLIFLRAQILPVTPEGRSCLVGAIITVIVLLVLWRVAKTLWKKDGHWDKGLRKDMIAMAMIAAIIGLFLLLVSGQAGGT